MSGPLLQALPEGHDYNLALHTRVPVNRVSHKLQGVTTASIRAASAFACRG